MSLPAWRIPRPLEGCEGGRWSALARMDLGELDEHRLRNPWASLRHESFEHTRERVVVALRALEIRPGPQHRAVVLGELPRALDPDAGVGGRMALVEMDLARLDGDRSALARAGGEIEAVLEKACDGLPILRLRREQERPFDRRRQERIVFEGGCEAARARARIA